MGVTIHYRGQLADPDRLEELEDLVIDLVLEIGGQVELLRLPADEPGQYYRGLLLNIEPGQETMSLLFSPDGWITPLWALGDKSQAGRPPTCFVKTQYGTPLGHAVIIEILAGLKQHFVPDLSVTDEADYWDHRDSARLAEQMERNARAIEAFAQKLEDHPLNAEAREDPAIVAKRVERVAEIVHRAWRQEDHGDSTPSADGDFDDWPDVERRWDELRRQSDANAFRLQRRIEESLLEGDSVEESVESAFDELPQTPPSNSGADAALESPGDEDTDEESVEDESWRGESSEREPRDPLLERATQLLLSLSDPAHAADGPDLLRHAAEVCGGLAQALPLPPPYELDQDERGLIVTQLKRALRGAAVLRGGLTGKSPKHLRSEVDAIQGEILDLLRQARPTPR